MPTASPLTLLAVVTALALPGPAVAQQDTTPLGDYAPPATSSTVETAPRPAPAPARTEADGPPAAAPAPVLASTGFEAGLVALAGLALMGAAVLVQRRARPRP